MDETTKIRNSAARQKARGSVKGVASLGPPTAKHMPRVREVPGAVSGPFPSRRPGRQQARGGAETTRSRIRSLAGQLQALPWNAAQPAHLRILLLLLLRLESRGSRSSSTPPRERAARADDPGAACHARPGSAHLPPAPGPTGRPAAPLGPAATLPPGRGPGPAPASRPKPRRWRRQQRRHPPYPRYLQARPAELPVPRRQGPPWARGAHRRLSLLARRSRLRRPPLRTRHRRAHKLCRNFRHPPTRETQERPRLPFLCGASGPADSQRRFSNSPGRPPVACTSL